MTIRIRKGIDQMIEVYQTRYGDKGNCFQACIASLLEVGLEDVPDFANKYPYETSWKECQKWARRIGCATTWQLEGIKAYTGYYIASCKVGEIYHSVIAKEGAIFHNPLGDKSNLREMKAGEVQYFFIWPSRISRFVEFVNEANNNREDKMSDRISSDDKEVLEIIEKVNILKSTGIPQIENDFMCHAPSENQQAKYRYLRAIGKSLAYAIYSECPGGKEKSLAITKLEETLMWANAAIARNE